MPLIERQNVQAMMKRIAGELQNVDAKALHSSSAIDPPKVELANHDSFSFS